MNRLSKEDLAQMNRDYFQSLDKQKLVEVAGNLHKLAVEQLEKLEQNSSNSSLPPSSDQFKIKGEQRDLVR
jgi:transposase